MTAANAHPVGGGPTGRSIVWTVQPASTTIRYEAEIHEAYLRLPVPDPVAAVEDELWSGLQLVVDGRAIDLERVASHHEPGHHSTHFSLDLSAALPGAFEKLELSDGNTPDARIIVTTAVRIGSGLEVLDSSLFVWEDGEVVRTDAGRPTMRPEARVTTLQVRHRGGEADRLHAMLQGTANRLVGPLEARRPTLQGVLTENRTTPVLAALLLFGAIGLGGGRSQVTKASLGAALLVVLLDLLLPLGGWRGVAAVVLALPLVGWPKGGRMVAALALLGSLDCRALPLLALPFMLLFAVPERADKPLRALLVLACLAQLFRLY